MIAIYTWLIAQKEADCSFKSQFSLIEPIKICTLLLGFFTSYISIRNTYSKNETEINRENEKESKKEKKTEEQAKSRV